MGNAQAKNANPKLPPTFPNKHKFESFPDDVFDMRLMLVGKSGTGKSRTGNTILGSDFFRFGSGFDSATRKCQVEMTIHLKKRIRVLDTCGLFDTRKVAEDVKTELTKALGMTAPGPHAFLLVLPLGERYTPEHNETVLILEEIFGHTFYDYTVVVFSKGDTLDQPIEDHLKSAPEGLDTLLSKVSRRYVVFYNNEKNESRRREAVYNLLNMVYDIYMTHKTHYSSRGFEKIEKLIGERDRHIKEQAEANASSCDRAMFLMKQLEKLSARVNEQSELLKNVYAETMQRSTMAFSYLARLVNVKQLEEGRGLLELHKRVGDEKFSFSQMASSLPDVESESQATACSSPTSSEIHN